MAGIDASKVRRQKRWRARWGKVQVAVWMILVAGAVQFVNWRNTQVVQAKVPADTFMAALAQGEPAPAREAVFTEALKLSIPDRIFQSQMKLVSRKLGHLDAYRALEDELTWNAQACKLVYQADFSRGPAQLIFEVVQDGQRRWRIDTFFVWSDNWKNL